MTAPILVPPEVERVLSAIRAAGGRPMLDGGFVRDSLMGVTGGKDIDMEVYGITDPDALIAALSAVGKVTEAGKVYGVIKVRAGGTDIDVSIPRREAKTGAGHRGFTVIPDGDMGFAEATARRDFTVNAILYDPATGKVIDCHGGLRDLKAGVLRHTSERFSEDPLRVLRGAQFAARFGFAMAPETAALCRLLIRSYGELSIERVWGEFEKVGTRGVDISAALEVLRDTQSIGCPEAVIARIVPLIAEHMNCFGRPTKPAVRRLVRRLQPATLTELAMVCAADAKGRGNPDALSPARFWLEVGRDLKVQERPAKGLLTGDHLIASGLRPGPAFKPILAEALAAQDAGEFEDEAGAVRWLEAREKEAKAS